jgi:hypothetical protein
VGITAKRLEDKNSSCNKRGGILNEDTRKSPYFSRRE